MRDISIMFYLFVYHICIIAFLWNFNTFTLQEKIIMFTLFSGFYCMGYIADISKDT